MPREPRQPQIVEIDNTVDVEKMREKLRKEIYDELSKELEKKKKKYNFRNKATSRIRSNYV